MSFHHGVLPKMSFPKFNGENLRIWIDKCGDYFRIFNIPECMWTMATSLHMEENVDKWLQVYKMKRGLRDWPTFVDAVEETFGTYNYRIAIQDLLSMKQEGMIGFYTRDFDDLFFTSQFLSGVKDEIKGVVQAQLPDSVDKVSMLAKIQEWVLEETKFKVNRSTTPAAKADAVQPSNNTLL
jgi:hypothetical protein